MSACTFNVNTTADRIDANIGDGICADATGACTLRAAVVEAHASSGVYRVAIPAGTYNLTHFGPYTDALEISKSIQLQGAGKDQTTIIGGDDIHAIFIEGGSDVRIQSLTISDGGMVFPYTRGITAIGGNVTLSNVAFNGNYSPDRGSALSVQFDSTVVKGNNLEFTNNRTLRRDNDGFQPYGGAIFNSGTLELTNSLIANNESAVGVGGILNEGSLHLSNVTVTSNVGGSDSYGIGAIEQRGSAVLKNVTIANNRGGGLGAANGTGGLRTDQNDTTLVVNSIIANNTRNVGGDMALSSDCAGMLSTGSLYNLIQAPEDCITPGSTTSIFYIDPQLAALADNGGPTRTLRLRNGSDAINSGSRALPGSSIAHACHAFDQRGVPRPQAFSSPAKVGICDIGAYEAGNLDAFVNQFILVNADTNADIGPLRHGDILYMDQLPPNLSIRAETSNNVVVQSITFRYDDTGSRRTENAAPYSIAGDSGGNYAPFSFGDSGDHTLRATPFSRDNASGTGGGSLEISFLVVEEED